MGGCKRSGAVKEGDCVAESLRSPRCNRHWRQRLARAFQCYAALLDLDVPMRLAIPKYLRYATVALLILKCLQAQRVISNCRALRPDSCSLAGFTRSPACRSSSMEVALLSQVCAEIAPRRRTLVWQLVTMARCQDNCKRAVLGVVIWCRVLHDQVLAAVLARVGPASRSARDLWSAVQFC